ncbi:MAG: M24 family metallopeptidase [Thermoplasmata archaeon]
MEQYLKNRIKKVVKSLEKNEIDTLIIKTASEPFIDSIFFYLSGITSGIFEESSLILKEGDVQILTYPLEAEAANESGLKVNVVKSRKEYEEFMSKALKGSKKIGINASALTAENYEWIKNMVKKAKIVDVSKEIEECKRIKDEKEIEYIKKAALIASNAFNEIKKNIKNGVSENEISAIIEYSMLSNGATGASFTTIVAAGKNSALPHYLPKDVKLKKGEFLLCDYGAKYSRYCSDITRTFAFNPKDKRMKEIYDIVLEAQLEAIKKIKPGMKGKEVHSIAAKIIDETKYKGKFIHGLGHSVGLEVHDGFGVNTSSEIVLEEGMVITIEPGIYVPGYGGVRIEDDILITDTGAKVLTSAPKEWDDIIVK